MYRKDFIKLISESSNIAKICYLRLHKRRTSGINIKNVNELLITK